MTLYVRLYVAQLFVVLEMFQTTITETIKTHSHYCTFYVQYFFPKAFPFVK
jgi:hypothetical protein